MRENMGVLKPGIYVQSTLDIDRWHNIVTVSYCVSLLFRRLRFSISFGFFRHDPERTIRALHMFQYRFFTHWMVVIPSWLVSAPCRDDARSTHAGCIRLHPLGMTFLHFSPLKVFSDLFRIIVDGFDGLWMDCDLEPFGAMGAEDTLGLITISNSRVQIRAVAVQAQKAIPSCGGNVPYLSYGFARPLVHFGTAHVGKWTRAILRAFLCFSTMYL